VGESNFLSVKPPKKVRYKEQKQGNIQTSDEGPEQKSPERMKIIEQR
jgi:hypothetical protein